MRQINLKPSERLIIALDVSSIAAAMRLVEQLSPVISTFKIGYSLMFESDLSVLLKALKADHKQIFFDAKLNDIPRTVQRGVESAARLGVDFITVHSDSTMLEAAMIAKANAATKIIAVTALTSIDAVASRVQFRAGLMNAIIAGCDGVTMSPHDLIDPIGKQNLRAFVGDMIIATPGVRLSGEQKNDHRRTGTPDHAISLGADYIVVGRPIIEADNPRQQAEVFISHLKG